MITEVEIYDALKELYDPEIPVNIVDLGLIYSLDIQTDGEVKVTMTLTFPGCPAAAFLPEQVHDCVAGITGVSRSSVEIVWDPPWTPEMLSPEAKRMLGWD